MRVIESCRQCLLDKQIAKVKRNPQTKKHALFIERVEEILENRKETDSAPYLVSLFNALYKEMFDDASSFTEIKRGYNALVLSMEQSIEEKIKQVGTDKKQQLAYALLYARVGNYIDFGAMNHVDQSTFLSLFEEANFSQKDLETFEQFWTECENASTFLLLADNCGEIVLDKIFLRILKETFPNLKLSVMVRGEEVLNDATIEDAKQSGIDQLAQIIPNGTQVAGTVYELITPKAQRAIDQADIILAKGQGNYETFAGNGRHAYYAFLCKCDLFTSRFDVPYLTGMFVAE